MATYYQAETHYSIEYALKRFEDIADVPSIPLKKYIRISDVCDRFGVPVRTALDRLDVLIPPNGEGLVHPTSLVRYIRRREVRLIKKVKAEIIAELTLLLGKANVD